MSIFDKFRKATISPANAAPQTPTTDDSSQQLGRPERPITRDAQDKLSRGAFISRLMGALIDPISKRSSGVVIGITGQWGSGKSSILNLLRGQLSKQHPDAVIVSFDPWLVSGRNDLISQFLAELISALKPASKREDKTRELISIIADYGETLSPALDWLHKGLGVAGKAGAKGLKALVSADKSLTGLKKQLETLLADFPHPIIVLIDELDRVEDAEIRAVAQLVRSVADFPSISYVLAYDPKRVIQALGEGANSEERERRGSAYLEKIVQLQVPLPLTFGEELIKLLNAELEKLPLAQGMPREFQKIERYSELTNVMLAGAIQTPRDISRLVGTFHALAGMVGAEVDKIDLLGYCALVAKSPRTIQKLRDQPDDFSDDIISSRALLRRLSSKKQTPEERLKEVLPPDGDQPGTGDLLKFLFPVFRDGGRSRDAQPDRISLRRPLLTVLRLGLIPGSYTQAEVERILTADPAYVKASLQHAKDNDTLSGLLDRINDLYANYSATHHIDFWKGVADFVRKPDCSWPSVYDEMHDIIRDVAGILERGVQRNPSLADMATRVFSNLRSNGDDVLTAIWLRHHIFQHRLFGRSTTDDRVVFLNVEQTQNVARDFSKEMRSKQLMHQLIPCRYDLQPVYTMIDTGEWDTICQKALQEDLKDDAALDGFTLMLYGAGFTTEKQTIDNMCSYDFYLQRVKERIANPAFKDLHESVKLALQKAADPVF